MKKSVKAIIIILLIICVGVFLFAGYKLISKEIEYKKAQNFYNDLSSAYTNRNDSEDSAPKATPKPEDEVILDDEVSPLSTDWDTLLKDYPDIVAWLYSPDTVINYPVAQYDDNAYYLNRQLNGTYNSSGTLFVECLNSKNFADNNNIIYGHHMNDGSMFASLESYSNQEFYEKHPVMYLNTPKYNYRIELFAAYVTPATSDTYDITLGDDASWQSYLDTAISSSKFTSDVDVKPGDKIITLSTCTYEYNDARYVVQGKLVPIH